MCSGPPRYYNLINRQAGRPSSPSEDQRTGFSICDYLAGGPGLSNRGFFERHRRARRIQEGGHSQILYVCEMVGKDVKTRADKEGK
jgi:hypothetical protein